jgi:hypothetical protein
MVRKSLILITLAYAVGCISGEKMSVSLYSNEEEITATILAHTPKGSKLAFVSKFISEDLEYNRIVSPPYKQSTGVRIQDKDDPQIINIIGEHSIDLLLGTYRDPDRLFLLSTDVYVQWAFDENEEVIDVFVYKYTQPP